MSLPPSSKKFSKEDWEAILETARKALGVDDSFPAIAAVHKDKPHQHLHFIVSRVSVKGKVLDHGNMGLKCAAVERIVEEKHGLKLVPPSEFEKSNKLKMGEIRKAQREKKLPARLEIKTAIEIAMHGKPTVQQFIERLNAANVSVKANISNNGKMSGFSFSFNDIAFKGSEVDRKFGWDTLKKGLQYVDITDSEFIAEQDGSTSSAGNDVARAIAVVNGLNTTVAEVSTQIANGGSDQNSDPAAIDRAVQVPHEESKRTDTEVIKPAKQAAKPVIAGFSRDEDLAPNLRSWAGGVHCRIGRFNRSAIQSRALFDAKNRLSAIKSGNGYAIPEPKALSDEQIENLLKEIGGNPIEIQGNPDFCARVEQIAAKIDSTVVHEHQVTEIERRALNERVEASKKANKEAPAPIPVP